MMRFTPAAFGAALILATVSTASLGAPPAEPIKARSIALAEAGHAALVAGRRDEANDLYVSALAVDPRNAAAYVALGQIAEAENLNGSAIRYYRDAIALAPDNRDAIAGEGAALAEKGAVDRARDSLARLKTLCRTNCPQVAALERAIAAGPRPEAVAVPPSGDTQDN
jgi:tetratricopeptide (TPR) repeat protein